MKSKLLTPEDEKIKTRIARKSRKKMSKIEHEKKLQRLKEYE